jgi:FMN-dependent oxidoreductase (nitrilotriacetate monooxygenase family)
MHLAFDLSWTHLEGRWRVPGSWTGRTYPNIGIFKEIASIAERGLIDMIFFGDNSGIPNSWRDSIDEAVRWGIGFPRQDALPYIAALAQVTKHVGFGLTYSSTFMHPYYVARLLNSLDHLTQGRIAFNVVTSTRVADAQNYGFDTLMPHDARYERLEEFVDVCKALWASVDPDAFVWDRETGIVVEDPGKVRPIDHVGNHFKVKGPLSCVPSPQGRPVLVQAGASPRGIQASAHFADYIFGAPLPTKFKVRHRQALDAALLEKGRDPGQVGILWNITLVVDETEADAKRRRDHTLDALPFEAAAAFISGMVGYDFSTLPARFRLRELNEAIAATGASPAGFVHALELEIGGETEITRDDFFEQAMLYVSGHHQTIAGTAAQVADHLEEEFEATGRRGGFMIAHPIATPRDLLNVVDFLIPELQRRGLYHTAYRGTTLRENLAI